ncbi:hypothetical protein WJX84_002666 [Apatococcus fuscideae]|uniref:Uncharacterized protein n=1 Tax=Apatococcus fuscideae TaxID=2026836 RepID=A0AAW1SZI0_9CHLO
MQFGILSIGQGPRRIHKRRLLLGANIIRHLNSQGVPNMIRFVASGSHPQPYLCTAPRGRMLNRSDKGEGTPQEPPDALDHLWMALSAQLLPPNGTATGGARFATHPG